MIKGSLNKILSTLVALCILLQCNVVVFATGEISSGTTTSTTMLAGVTSSSKSSGRGIAKTDGAAVNYTYTGDLITSSASLYDYVSDEELNNNDPVSTADGWADPYTRFNSAISASTNGTYEVSPASQNLTIRYKSHVKDLTIAYVYLFDDSGHSTGWSSTPLTYSGGEWYHTFVYDSLGFTPTKFIIWGNSSYGEWQTDDITCALAKGSSYLYDDAKEVSGTANRISVSIPIANARVTAVGGVNKRDQKLHLRKKSSSNVQVNMYGGYSGKVNMTESSGSWIANNMNVSSASGDITVSIRSDGYWDKDGNARTDYYAETVPFVVTKGHNYTFNDWGNLGTGTAYVIIKPKNILYAPLYFGCFYRGDNSSDYTLNNKADYSSFWWLPNISVRGSSNASVQGLVDDTLTNGVPTQDGVAMPYFDSTWVSGDVSRTGLMLPYEGLDFPFYGIKIDATTVKGDADATGYAKYYQFCSKDTNLKYDRTLNQFVETNIPIHSQGTQSSASGTVGFYPFNTVDDNTKLNLGFGARFDISFKLNSNGKVETVDANGVPTGTFVDAMFEFMGDDDVWVFIDDKLILDLGGCHKDTTGVIDFATRKAYANNAVTFIKDGGDTPTNRDNLGVSTAPVEVDLNTAMKSSTFVDGVYNEDTTHVLTMFYMERGMYESDLLIRYNFATLSNTNTFKIREVTKFTGINAGLIDATKKAAEYDVWQYQITNTSNESGSASGLLTPVYDTYTRTNQGLTSKLSGQPMEDDVNAIYMDLSLVLNHGTDGEGNTIYDTWEHDGAKIAAYLYADGMSDKTVLAQCVDAEHHLYRIDTEGRNKVQIMRIKSDSTMSFPASGFPTGKYWNRYKLGVVVQGYTYQNTGWGESNWSIKTTIPRKVTNYVAHNFEPNVSNYVATVNYLWTDGFSERTGTQNNLLIGTTSANGILSLMHGTTSVEASAEFQRQFTRGSTMTVEQQPVLKTPAFNGNIETFANTLSRNYSTYYNTSVSLTDAVSNSLTRTGNSFVYDNKSGVSDKVPVQIIETFENTPRLGAITITKTVQNGDTGNSDNRFKMQLELKDIFGVENNNISDYDNIEASVDIDSDGYFYMIGGQTVVISGIPYGTQYKISEVDSGANYTQVSNTNAGYETVYEGFVTNNQSSVASNNETIVNTRLLGTLNIVKDSYGYIDSDISGTIFNYIVTLNQPSGVDFSNYSITAPVAPSVSGTTYTYVIPMQIGDTKQILNIPYGTTYQVVEQEAANWLVHSQSGVSGNINTTPITATITNEYNVYADIDISKTVRAIDSYIDTNTDFEFTVTLTDQSGTALADTKVYDTEVNGVAGTLSFTNGVAIITLGHDDHYVIKHIPYKYHYSVTETTNALYQTNASQSGIITDNTTYNAVFENIPRTGTLKLKKVVNNKDSGIAESSVSDFTFTVTLSNLQASRSYATYAVTHKGVAKTLEDIVGHAGASATVTFNVGLGHNDELLISGLPVGTVVQVMEQAVQVYKASYVITGSTLQASSTANTERNRALSLNIPETINDNESVVITYTNEYEFIPYSLPASGFEDSRPLYIVLITGMLLCAIVFIYVSNRKRVE